MKIFKSYSKHLTVLMHLLFVACLVVSAGTVYSNSRTYETLKTEIHKESLLKNKIVEIFMPSHSKRIAALNEMSVSYHHRSLYGMALFFVVAGVYIVLSTFKRKVTTTCRIVLIVSSIALATGLTAPVLNVVFYETLPLLGKFVVNFESIGVISSIHSWWGSGNYFIATIVLLFSFIVPIIKTFSMGFILSFPENPMSQKMLKFFELIGSWAMLDVFVVAIMIVAVSINGKEAVSAEIRSGLYFFVSYVILSMIATQLFAVGRRYENAVSLSRPQFAA